MAGLEVRYVADTLANPPAAPPVLVDGMVRAGELCVIGAPRASGKSWLAMNLAALVARGEGDLFGRLAVRRSVPVLLCHGETPPWMAAARWSSLLGGCVPGPLAESFDRWHVKAVRTRRSVRSERSADLVLEEATEGRLDPRLRETIDEHRIGLLVVDPWACFYAGLENSNDETEAALDMLRALAEATGVAIVILHHLGKERVAHDPEDLWRGASRLADAASTRVTLLPAHSDKEAAERGLTPDEARRLVTVSLLRREAPTPGFTARLETSGWWKAVADPVVPQRLAALSRTEPRSARLTAEDVARALEAAGGRWDSLGAAASALSLPNTAARSVLHRAVAAGLVTEEPGRGSARAFLLAPRDPAAKASVDLLRDAFDLGPDST